MTKEPSNNYILTNVLGDIDRDYKKFKIVQQIAIERKSLFVPVKLIIAVDENIKRIKNKDRLVKFKSIDAEDVKHQLLINIKHPNLLTLDVTKLSKEEAANVILNHIAKLKL